MLEPDINQIEIFVDAIFRHAKQGGFVSVRAFFDEEANRSFRISPAALTADRRHLLAMAEDDARRAAQYPKPITFCPPIAVFWNKDRCREEDLAEGPAISVECDEHPQQARTTLEAVLGPPTVVVRSGGIWTNGNGEAEDKLHLHWRLVAPARTKDELRKLKRARELAAKIVGGDPTCAPINHPLRWPGSWHRKAEPRLCEIETLNADVEIDLETALGKLIARAPAESTKAKDSEGSEANGGDGSAWTELMAAVFSSESYHEPLIRLAMMLLKSGMADGAAVNMLRGWMNAATGARDQRWQSRYDDIPRGVKTAREKIGGEEAGQDAGQETRTNSDLFTQLHWHGDGSEIIKQPALIEGLLPETGAGLISGQWGTYKSFVAIDIAGAVMTGGFLLDFPVARRGGVLFIAAEGANSIGIRLQAMLAEKYPAVARAPFTWLGSCPALLSPKSVTLLTEMARKADERMLSEFGMPLVLIVIDTITAAAGYSKSGDENDAAVASMIMNRLAALSRGTGALVLGIDHFGKSIEVGTRGSSAKEAAADVVLATLGDKAVSGEVTNTLLAVRKNRSGPSGQEFAFAARLVETGNSEGSLVIDWQPHKPSPKAEDQRWSKSLRLLRQCLMNMLADCGSEQRPYADGLMVRAVDQETLRGEFCKSYPADGTPGQKADARRQAFSRAIRDAQRKELIGVRDIGTTTFVWLATPKAHD